MAGHDIIVVGTSAGGVDALQRLVRGLTQDLEAAVFVVLHTAPQSFSQLPRILERAGPLPAAHAENEQPIEYGRIYVAPPDYHLLVELGHVRVVRGPRENRHRPAIDPLFRSAARAYGPQVVGVILTGALDDGTAGLQTIKMRGGIAVVQDPEEAAHASMPQSALQHVAVDYCMSVNEIGPLLGRLAQEAAADQADYPVPAIVEIETQVQEGNMENWEHIEHMGTPSVYTCPECHGTLWELQQGELIRFRCRVGHAYSAESIMADQTDSVERAMWAACRSLEEKASLARRLAGRARQSNQMLVARRFEEQAEESDIYAEQVRRILVTNGKGLEGEEQVMQRA